MPSTITDAARALRRGDITSADLVQHAIDRAAAVDAALGTYIARFDESALDAARAADKELAVGIDRGPLHGVPIGVKDIIAAREGVTTAGSRVLKGWGERRDATAVARLRDAGAVITGKTSTSEFAIGAPDDDGPFPVPHSPWDVSRWPGGSSSGSATGVAAGLMLGALGSDTLGSIRIPSALCGISGLKTTFGRVPMSHVVPLSYTMDTVGPMARSAADCAIILQAIAGDDARDQYAADRAVPDYRAALVGELAGLRIGVEREHHTAVEGFNPLCAERFEAAIAVLRALGADVVDVRFEGYELMTAAALVTCGGDALAYHLGDLRTRYEDYGRSCRKLLTRGVLYTAADYVQAQRVRAWGLSTLGDLFERCDAIVTPTTGVASPPSGADYWAVMGPWTYTPAWNLLGVPAMSIPMGSIEEGLPSGLQIIGPHFSEARLLRIADAYQRSTDWHLHEPPMVARS
jgi:aspartyl-tRNA(Asn)/glutamyl-tRNA(Gln) amidotransferase subunit A